MHLAIAPHALDPAQHAIAVLVDAGVPIGSVARSGRTPGASPMAAAVHVLVGPGSAAFEPWILEAVAAWILGWAHEWPGSFAEAFGADAYATASWARAHILDHGRYIKLRRIAIANLANLL